MNKKILIISVMLVFCLSGCNIDKIENEHNSLSSEEQVTIGTSKENIMPSESKTDTGDSVNSETAPSETDSQHSLPENVILNILGHILSNKDLTEINFGENGVWSSAKYDGFVYMAETSENDFKKYNIGDKICGLKLTSARNIFGNDYLDNENHEEYHCTSIAEFDGTLTMTGTLTIAEEDGANLMTKKGDIIFSPEENIFPIISGLPDNRYYNILCGNINDNVISKLMQLPLGEKINAKVTVSDIMLYSAMPVDANVRCKIDHIDLLQ